MRTRSAGTDRPLEDAAQPGQRPLVDHHHVARLEIVLRQPARGLDLGKTALDQDDGRVRHHGRPAIETQDATQAGDPLEVFESR